MADEVRWKVWVDTGGTFTDCLAIAPDGTLRSAKVLSSARIRGSIVSWLDSRTIRFSARWAEDSDLPLPAGWLNGAVIQIEAERTAQRDGIATIVRTITDFDPVHRLISLDRAVLDGSSDTFADRFEVEFTEEAPTIAARLVTGTPVGCDLPAMELRLATTRGTNALLERKGADCVFITTKGFGDLLRIGNQQRPDLFALKIEKPEPLYSRVIEIDERVDARGEVLKAINEATLDAIVDELDDNVPRARVAAVALMHSYRAPDHERQVRERLRQCGFGHVSCSHEVAPFMRIMPRAETAVVDAYLSPVIGDYAARIREKCTGRSRLLMMTSAGGLQPADSFRAKDSLLSGPAGGVAGSAAAAKASGVERFIAFDMGGTSTDVSRFDGDFEYDFEHEVGDAHLLSPALAIHTVAAGGGSICWFDGRRLRVGPESAGADPGPACYGCDGPFTLTDVNLLLGRIVPDRFGIPVDIDASKRAMRVLREQIGRESGESITEKDLLRGCLDIANERMADAVRRVSLRRGFDPAEYTLVAFGGAGGQHACAVAERLDMTRILVPRYAGLLSAAGLGGAVIQRFAERQLLARAATLDDDELRERCRGLHSDAQAQLRSDGVEPGCIRLRRIIAALRFVGQDSTVEIDLESAIEDLTIEACIARFREQYRCIYGHLPEDREIELVSLRVIASSIEIFNASLFFSRSATAQNTIESQLRIGGSWTVRERTSVWPGERITGPAIIVEDHSVTVVERGWLASIDAAGAIVMQRTEIQSQGSARTTLRNQPAAVELELFTNRFGSIAGEMGEMLRKTALSTNVKERLDFSCAILDAAGDLVVNAPHIPVHLGALGECVRAVKQVIEFAPGDIVVTNHPAFGGSHLPDVSVIAPVFVEDKEFNGSPRLIAFVANRAHHAEIGGTRPGSMPPQAKCLAEEGVVIPPMYLYQQGRSQWDALRRVLADDAVYPTRALAENLEDLAAAVASVRRGIESISRLVEVVGPPRATALMESLKEQAESRIRAKLRAIGDGEYEAEELLDDGTRLCATVSIHGDAATIDFTGADLVHPGNLNATPAIVRSAVMYVLRLLLDEPLPLNEGLMRAVELIIPRRSLLNPEFASDPRKAPAVVGGNVETSQRLVDTLIKAFGLSACSQGTMNNVLFGNDRFGYYETVAGGAGAGPEFNGASGVHTHMTNTRITDPEVLEHRYPVRLVRFGLRGGSGGRGEFAGGDGVVREYEFLESMSLSILSQHRTVQPFGMHGGEPGVPGVQTLVRAATGKRITLASIDGVEVEAGDRLILETPGGGGWGRK